jgi:NAD(P)-dependent dehydrogenase (short-subunit alcohol dehydrogenase family)
MEDITDRVPMARFASPDDIASAVLFLADPKQSGLLMGKQLRWMAVGPQMGPGRVCALRHR